MRPDPEIDSQLALLVRARVGELGPAASEAFARAGVALDPSATAVRMRLSELRRMTEVAEEIIGDPHFALAMARLPPPGFYGIADLAVRAAPTIGAAFERIARYSRLLTPAQTCVACRQERDAFVVEYHVRGGEPPFGGRHVNEFALGMLHRVMNELATVPARARAVAFAHPATSDLAVCRDYFGTSEISFDAPVSSIHYELAVIDTPTRAAPNDTMLSVFDARALALLGAREDELERQIAQAVSAELREGPPTVVGVAKRMGITSRTLQRRLKDKGTSFRSIVEGVRRDLALDHVGRVELTIAEIAFLLGYAEPRAFARAFQRWTGGMGPRAYRQHHTRR